MKAATGYRLGKRAVTRDRTRERILEAAELLYRERWYDDVSLREVAAGADVALQTVVNHFRSKGGLLALTHALAISLGPEIRVNCVSPGWIVTARAEALRRKDHLQHPAGRAGRPEDVAEIVALLLDKERSGFLTGAELVVDGGMTRKMIYVE